MTDADEELELARDDLITYLVRRLEVPREDVLARLGNWLVDPVPEERRQQYARANEARNAAR